MTIVDEFINYDERLVGANHPSRADTLNRALAYHVNDTNPSHTITNILLTNNTANVNLQMGSGFDILLGADSQLIGGSINTQLANITNLDSDFIVSQEAYFVTLSVGGGFGGSYEGYYDGYYGGDIYDRPGGLFIDENGNIRTDGTIYGTHLLDVKVITGNHTANIRDRVLLVDTTDGDVNIYLPGNPIVGLTFDIKKIDISANEVIVDAIGRNIDGDSTKTISVQYDCMTIISDGNNWFVI